MYADALAHAATDPDATERDLLWCKYWMWELRDAYEELAPLYARAWRYESRDGHLASNLERYHLAAQKAIDRPTRFYRATASSTSAPRRSRRSIVDAMCHPTESKGDAFSFSSSSRSSRC